MNKSDHSADATSATPNNSTGRAVVADVSASELYMRLLRYVRPYWKTFAIGLIAMVVYAATVPAMPALLKPMIDGSFVAKDPTWIQLVPILLIVIVAVQGIAGFVRTVAVTWVANRVIFDIRNEMFRRVTELPTTFFDHNASGNVISRITYDVTQVSMASTTVLISLVSDSLTVLGLLGYMFYANWKLSLVSFVVGPVIALVVLAIANRLRRLSRDLQNSMGDMTHILEEAISANKVVKIFQGEEYERRRFQVLNNWVRRLEVKLSITSGINGPLVQLIVVSVLAGIVYIAALDSAANKTSLGSFMAFIAAMAMLFSPVKRLTSLNERLQRGLAAAASIFTLLDEKIEQNTGTRHIEHVKGDLRVEDVTFRYPTASRNALEKINLYVPPGHTCALVGASGSGKTTLVNLIPRFYELQEGRILLDGIDIRELTLDSLRRHIALVSQDVVLFNDTVAANIAYGAMQDASEEDIVNAARAAHALEFIEQMPQGMRTLIGERGVRLSGGQRQRLAIARAVLKNAPVLILDEATAALDTHSERYVQAGIEALRRNRTTIVIAHRLSTVEKADLIVMMDSGRIIETGNHHDLLERNAAYASLYRAQFATQKHGPA